MTWLSKKSKIKAVLSDITGVLIDGYDGVVKAVPGAPQAVARLKASGIPIRFVTNESSCTKDQLVQKLVGHGFEIKSSEIFSPPPAMLSILKERNLRPHLLVHPDVEDEFTGIDMHNPNCVVVGDAQHSFSYDKLNQAFRLLMDMKPPQLFSLGYGKYYKDCDGLQLDVGAYAKALEYATGLETEVVGKPSVVFYNTACSSLDLQPEEVLMIGDDIVSDVGGAQNCGLLGIQVRTGKFVASRDEPHPTVIPDGYVDNLSQFVDLLLQS